MPTVKIHGVTLLGADIAEFFPVNSTHPDFGYFLFHYQRFSNGHYYFDVYAVTITGDIIKKVTSANAPSVTPISLAQWIDTDVYITVTDQLSRIVTPGQKITKMDLRPMKYGNNYAGYNVDINIDQQLATITKLINPSPPATAASNRW